MSGAKGRMALETGDVDAGLLSAGQVLGLIHDIPSCHDLIQGIMTEAQEIIQQRLNRLID